MIRQFIYLMILLSSVLGFSKSKSNSYVSLGLKQPDLILSVENRDTDEVDIDEKTILYEPRLPTVASATFSVNGISASYSHNLSGGNEDEIEFTDYRLSFYKKWFGIEGKFSEFYRFRINSSTGFEEELTEEESLREDLLISFTSANVYFFPFRFGYDLENALNVDTIKRTGLAFGLLGSYNQTLISSENGLIPEQWRQDFGPDGRFGEGMLGSTNLLFSINGVLAFGPFYVSTMLALGAGNQFFEYDSNTETRTGKGIADKDNVNFSAGISFNGGFVAFKHELESPVYNLKHMALVVESAETSLTVGVRF